MDQQAILGCADHSWASCSSPPPLQGGGLAVNSSSAGTDDYTLYTDNWQGPQHVLQKTSIVSPPVTPFVSMYRLLIPKKHFNSTYPKLCTRYSISLRSTHLSPKDFLKTYLSVLSWNLRIFAFFRTKEKIIIDMSLPGESPQDLVETLRLTELRKPRARKFQAYRILK